ncbi:diacylglycerol kinase family protein [Halobacillus rhizosphaerae]|uniref:diacylglycerol kinase family protein n=1 Tax=Halobacillus rhizosphaerae TaxID=3064889 RepID=UPI00398B7624
MNSDSRDPKKKSIGFRFAWNGIMEVARTERNFRIHLLAAGLVVAAGLVLSISLVEWAVLFTIIPLVLALEMVNSSIERVLNYLAPEIHPLVGIMKDISAGAVLIASLSSVIIALLIFLPKFLNLF